MQFKSWSGYAFENICLKHIAAIKKALSIGGVYSESSTYYKKGSKYQNGLQIDLLIDRNDRECSLKCARHWGTKSQMYGF